MHLEAEESDVFAATAQFLYSISNRHSMSNPPVSRQNHVDPNVQDQESNQTSVPSADYKSPGVFDPVRRIISSAPPKLFKRRR
jgi:hypothetical protein